MTLIYDLSDPAKPVFIRAFGLPGQEPGATGPVPTDLHGPISTGPKGNRVYFGYGTNKGGIVQIVDRQKLLSGPKEPTKENLLYPQVGRLDLPPNAGAHTAFPMLGVELPEFAKDKDGRVRDFVVITDEAIANECLEARQMVWIADITTEPAPFGVSNWTVPEKSGGFCGRGGRFGTHSSNENFTPIYYKRVMFFAHFNAGVRAVDVRDPPFDLGLPVFAEVGDVEARGQLLDELLTLARVELHRGFEDAFCSAGHDPLSVPRSRCRDDHRAGRRSAGRAGPPRKCRALPGRDRDVDEILAIGVAADKTNRALRGVRVNDEGSLTEPDLGLGLVPVAHGDRVPGVGELLPNALLVEISVFDR